MKSKYCKKDKNIVRLWQVRESADNIIRLSRSLLSKRGTLGWRGTREERLCRFGWSRDGWLPGKRHFGVEKNFRVKRALAWAVQGWGTYWEEGNQGEKNSRVHGTHVWTVQGWLTSWVGRRGYLYQFITYFRWSSFNGKKLSSSRKPDYKLKYRVVDWSKYEMQEGVKLYIIQTKNPNRYSNCLIHIFLTSLSWTLIYSPIIIHPSMTSSSPILGDLPSMVKIYLHLENLIIN